jgi:Spy/CpxP family protein refolding chaperone
MNDIATTGTASVRRWIGLGRLAAATAALALAALIGIALAGSASAGWGWGMGHHGFGGRFAHGGMMGGTLDPAEIEDHVKRIVGHIAVEIDATEEQKAKLTEIFVAAARDLMPIRAEFMESRQAGELVGLLTAPTVDRAAIEAFRAEKMALAERASRRLAQALADAAEVLTPEQRAEIGERIEFLRSFGPPFHRG